MAERARGQNPPHPEPQAECFERDRAACVTVEAEQLRAFTSGVPVIAGLAALLTSALAQRLRPIRMSTLTED